MDNRLSNQLAERKPVGIKTWLDSHQAVTTIPGAWLQETQTLWSYSCNRLLDVCVGSAAEGLACLENSGVKHLPGREQGWMETTHMSLYCLLASLEKRSSLTCVALPLIVNASTCCIICAVSHGSTIVNLLFRLCDLRLFTFPFPVNVGQILKLRLCFCGFRKLNLTTPSRRSESVSWWMSVSLVFPSCVSCTVGWKHLIWPFRHTNIFTLT